jgi:hypothetical protein
VVGAVELTDALAAYAAGLSTLTAVVGYLTWRHNTQTRVDVRSRLMTLHTPGGSDEHIVTIEMINRSPHEVAVTHVGFRRGSGENHLFIPRPYPSEGPLPIVIAPKRAKWVRVQEDTLMSHADETLRPHVSTDDDHSSSSRAFCLAAEQRKAQDRLRAAARARRPRWSGRLLQGRNSPLRARGGVASPHARRRPVPPGTE